MINVLPKKSDDIEFTRFVENVLNNSISSLQPNEVYLVQVDRRFDYKWMAFSNKILGAVGAWHSQELRIPPFVPEKIVEESHFQNVNGKFIQTFSKPLHIHQTSGDNRYRKIKSLSNSAIILWYSGETAINSQASLMFYSFLDGAQSFWFASFINNANWQIRGTKNISKNELHNLSKNNFLAAV